MRDNNGEAARAGVLAMGIRVGVWGYTGGSIYFQRVDGSVLTTMGVRCCG